MTYFTSCVYCEGEFVIENDAVISQARTQAIDDCIKVVRERAAEHLRQAAEFDASDDFMAADADHCRELAKDLFVIASHLEALKGKTEKKWPGELKDDPSSARD